MVYAAQDMATTAGIVGASIQGRREHSKWVREQRFAAYTAFAAALAHVRSVTAENPQVLDAAVIRLTSPSAAHPVRKRSALAAYAAAVDAAKPRSLSR